MSYGPEDNGTMTQDAQHWIEGFEAMGAQTATGALGAKMVSIDDEGVVLEIEITDAARQPYGLLHGGVSLLLAETAASTHSAWLCDTSKEVPVGVDINGTHISGAREGRIHTIAKVVRKARSLVFHEVDVVHVDTGRTLCKARVTNYLKPIG
ncbi:MAG: PaaI family thioesterase [Myxococcota bacterium]